MMNNRARDILKDACRQQGAEIYTDARLCRNLLNDLCGDCYTEVRVLAVAVEEGIVQGLEMQLKHQPREMVVAAAVTTLARKAALQEDAARWAVEAWISALDIVDSEEPEGCRESEGSFSSWELCTETSRQNREAIGLDLETSIPGIQKLNEDSSVELIVQGEWIYYLNENDNRSIYRISASGSCRQKLNDDCSTGLVADREWLFYVNASDRNSIYRIAIDGSRRQKLNDDWSSNIVAAGGWLYFNERGHTCRMGYDGSCRQKLNQDRSREIKVDGEWVYYVNRSDHNRIYRMRGNNDR